MLLIREHSRSRLKEKEQLERLLRALSLKLGEKRSLLRRMPTKAKW
jgi:hypothetical protein